MILIFLENSREYHLLNSYSIESFVIYSTIDAYLITPAFGSNAKSSHVDQQRERLYVMPGKAWL